MNVRHVQSIPRDKIAEPAQGDSAQPTHPQEASRKRPWWQTYRNTILSIAMQATIAAYVGLLNLTNTVPDPSRLIQLKVEVIRFYEHAPHLIVRFPDGTKKPMEFPTAMSIRPSRFSLLPKERRVSAEGCIGHVLGVAMAFVPDERLRVWEIDCGPLRRAFKDIQAYFHRSIGAGLKIYIGFLFASFLFALFVFWVDRRAECKGIYGR